MFFSLNIEFDLNISLVVYLNIYILRTFPEVRDFLVQNKEERLTGTKHRKGVSFHLNKCFKRNIVEILTKVSPLTLLIKFKLIL